MPVPTTRNDLNVTESLNSPAGSEAIGTSLDNYIRSHAAIIKQYVTDIADGTSASKGSSLIGFLQAGTSASARTAQAKLREFISAKDFGVVGDGVTEDTTAMNAALVAASGRVLFLPAGTYLCKQLIIYSGTTLVGEGGGVSIIKAHASLGNIPLIKNATQTGTVDTYADTDIDIDDVVFDGNTLSGRTAELLSFGKVRRLNLGRGMRVRNIGYIGVAVGGCRDVFIDSQFHNCGNPSVTAEGGAALWFGAAGDGSLNYDVTVGEFARFFDNQWSGIYGNGCRNLTISGKFRNNYESSIFVNKTTTGLKLIGVDIDGTTIKNISASGIEIGCDDFQIVGGRIANCAADSVSITNAQHGVIRGLRSFNARRDSVNFPQGSDISIITTVASPNQPKNIEITGVDSWVSSSAPYAAINIGNSGDAVVGVFIHDNDFSSSTYSSGKAINFAAGKWGANCRRYNNIGTSDTHFVVGEFQGNSVVGAQSVTGVGFKPRRIEFWASKQSAAQMEFSTSVVNGSGTAVCHGGAADGTNASGGTLGSRAVLLLTPAGATDYHADFTSYNDDGFTITVVTGGFQPWIRYVAYP